jgi:hypothetical protein
MIYLFSGAMCVGKYQCFYYSRQKEKWILGDYEQFLKTNKLLRTLGSGSKPKPVKDC